MRRFANYNETLSYLFGQLPMYQRVGASAYKKDLTNTLKLCEAIGNPHLKFKSVHIAGTNGKGTVSHLVAYGLQRQGYKVGLYTSPHYKDFRERIKINGILADKKYITGFVTSFKKSSLPFSRLR
jgi:dihydrofolate synthase / folylpolyglutamate synthase